MTISEQEAAAPSEEPVAAFGEGKVVVDTGTFHGRPSVFIAPAIYPGEVGASAARERHDLHSLQPGEIVLTFPTDAQARAVEAALIASPAPVAVAPVLLNVQRPKTVEELDRLLNSEDTDRRIKILPDGSIEELPPVPVAVAPVGVKALEWEEAIHGGWCALGAAGLYHVHIGYRDETSFYFFTNPFDHEPNDFCSERAAKAAAQADYEARILSSIIPAAKPAGVEQIAECMWQAEWARAGNGGLRKVPWTEIAEVDRERFRFVARAVAALSGGTATPKPEGVK